MYITNVEMYKGLYELRHNFHVFTAKFRLNFIVGCIDFGATYYYLATFGKSLVTLASLVLASLVLACTADRTSICIVCSL